jgi:hypothetical protein
MLWRIKPHKTLKIYLVFAIKFSRGTLNLEPSQRLQNIPDLILPFHRICFIHPVA